MLPMGLAREARLGILRACHLLARLLATETCLDLRGSICDLRILVESLLLVRAQHVTKITTIFHLSCSHGGDLLAVLPAPELALDERGCSRRFFIVDDVDDLTCGILWHGLLGRGRLWLQRRRQAEGVRGPLFARRRSSLQALRHDGRMVGRFLSLCTELLVVLGHRRVQRLLQPPELCGIVLRFQRQPQLPTCPGPANMVGLGGKCDLVLAHAHLRWAPRGRHWLLPSRSDISERRHHGGDSDLRFEDVSGA
mmetsp:Transcript_47393/g.120021  ORF Transcript_47393/g.120021 Transcript_47393/m.120021 type:complete len:253 (+) Transcript_47393:137-895(+)